MSKEVHAIPPAPRYGVRWGTALAYRWPLALFAFLFIVYGGLWTVMLLFASEGKPIDDSRLDTEARIASGRVIRVQPTKTHIGKARAVIVDFEFDNEQGLPQAGASFAPEGAVEGAAVAIEFLPDSSHVNRVQGGRISLLSNFHRPAFWITVVPGSCFLALWLFGVLRTRRVLVHGDVAIAHVLDHRELPYVQPTMLSVHFSFRDRRAVTCVGHHWVRARSSLGTRLFERPEDVVVVHDRDHPKRTYRLMVASEFAQRTTRDGTGNSDPDAHGSTGPQAIELP